MAEAAEITGKSQCCTFRHCAIIGATRSRWTSETNRALIAGTRRNGLARAPLVRVNHRAQLVLPRSAWFSGHECAGPGAAFRTRPPCSHAGRLERTLLSFYDFPAEHWKHLRTTNFIESSFATIRHRTVRSKGCLYNKTALAMIFKLA